MNSEQRNTAADSEVVVLLAEDDDQIRQLITAVLSSQGWTVLSAPNAAEALRIFYDRRRQIDLLLTDVEMGEGMNGFALAERVLLDKPGVAVLVISGIYEASSVPAGKCLPFLRKPFTVTALIQNVQEVLAARSRKRLEGEYSAARSAEVARAQD